MTLQFSVESYANHSRPNLICPRQILNIQGEAYFWPNARIGKTITTTCGQLYAVTLKRQCLPSHRWSPSAAETISYCSQNLNLRYVNDVLFYGLYPLAVLVITVAAIILVWLRQFSAEERYRLFFFLFVAIDASLFAQIIRWPLPNLLDDYSEVTRLCVCITAKIVVLYFNEAQNYWLLNVGIFLFMSVVHPLKHRNDLKLPIHGIGWGMPCVTVTAYMIALAVSTKGNLQAICAPYPPLTEFYYMLDVPCLLTFCANLFFIIKIMSVMRRQLLQKPGSIIPTEEQTHISRHVKQIIKSYIWLFGVMGQWKVFAIVPAWELSSKAQFFYGHWLTFLTGLSCIATTIPACYCSREVRTHIHRILHLRKLRLAMRTELNRGSSTQSSGRS